MPLVFIQSETLSPVARHYPQNETPVLGKKWELFRRLYQQEDFIIEEHWNE